jgi:hypothetical protein
MSEPPKRRPWFQFHLSTALWVMLAAGALLGLNLVPRDRNVWMQVKPDHIEGLPYPPGYPITYTCRGWPLSYIYPEDNFDWALERFRIEHEPPPPPPPPPPDPTSTQGTDVITRAGTGWIQKFPYPEKKYLIVNAIVGLVLLFVLAVASEWFIRRRERRS